MFNKKEIIMIEFNKTDIQLINDLWAFLSTCGSIELVEDALGMESKNMLKGWLLYESEEHPDRYFDDLDLLEKAVYVKKGVAKYE
jgi:hypothetical protein